MKRFARRAFVSLALGLLFVSTPAFGQQVDLYDSQGNYSYGTIDRAGSIDLYDSQGNYSYGNVDRAGNVDLYDSQGNYSYGNVDRARGR